MDILYKTFVLPRLQNWKFQRYKMKRNIPVAYLQYKGMNVSRLIFKINLF
jgi:hypothetical protein